MSGNGTTSPAPSGTITVDLGELRRMAEDVRGLAAEFSDRNGTLQGLLDDPDLGRALRHAERDWWDQRRRIHAFLVGLADAVTSSVSAYEQAEKAVVQASKGAASHP